MRNETGRTLRHNARSLTAGLLVVLLTMGTASPVSADAQAAFVVAEGETVVLSGLVEAESITVYGTIQAAADVAFSADTIHVGDTARILGADGARGASVAADSATATHGGDGGSLTFTAKTLTVEDGAHVQAGSGGAGGNAFGSSLAVAGSGGSGGSIHVNAASVDVGAPLFPGAGGDGGHAIATGVSSSGPAHGGDGGDSGSVYVNGVLLHQDLPDVKAPDTTAPTAYSPIDLRSCMEAESCLPFDWEVKCLKSCDPCANNILKACGGDPQLLCFRYSIVASEKCGGSGGELPCTGSDCSTRCGLTCDPAGSLTKLVEKLVDGEGGELIYLVNGLLTNNPSCLNAHGADGLDNSLGDGGDGGHGCTQHQGIDGNDGANGRDDPIGCTDGGSGGHGNAGSANDSSGGNGGDGTRNGGDGGSASTLAYGGRGGDGGNGGQNHTGPDCAGGHGGNGGSASAALARGGNGGQGLCGHGGEGGGAASIAQGGAGGAGGAGRPSGLAGLPGVGNAAGGEPGIKGGTGADVCPS